MRWNRKREPDNYPLDGEEPGHHVDHDAETDVDDNESSSDGVLGFGEESPPPATKKADGEEAGEQHSFTEAVARIGRERRRAFAEEAAINAMHAQIPQLQTVAGSWGQGVLLGQAPYNDVAGKQTAQRIIDCTLKSIPLHLARNKRYGLPDGAETLRRRIRHELAWRAILWQPR